MFESIKYFWKLRRQYYDRNVLIIGAGPSVNMVHPDQVAQLQRSGWCIVALKQASTFYPNFDIAIANDVREVEIQKTNEQQQLIGVSEPKFDLDWDVKLKIFAYRWSLTLLNIPNLAIWNPLFNPYRPWGVGVFFEVAIFLPYIFRSKQIATIGFDMALSHKNGFNHFYGTEHGKVFDDGIMKEISLIGSCTKKIREIFSKRNCEIRSLTVYNSPISFIKYTESENFFADLSELK